jgi:hypothetical protein
MKKRKMTASVTEIFRAVIMGKSERIADQYATDDLSWALNILSALDDSTNNQIKINLTVVLQARAAKQPATRITGNKTRTLEPA